MMGKQSGMVLRRRQLGFLVAGLLGAIGCAERGPNSETSGTGGSPVSSTGGSGSGAALGSGGQAPIEEPGTGVTLKQAIPAELVSALDAASGLDGASLEAGYPSATVFELGYDPSEASGLDLIQNSALKLADDELAILIEKGLVITARQQFPSFAYGYKTIYSEDLPVYVSADSILQAVHVAFDSFLARTEQLALIPDLKAYLSGMRNRIGAEIADGKLAAEADLYLAVAFGLLTDTIPAPVSSTDRATIQELIELGQAAKGTKDIELFGSKRTEDFSQFKPRGHYTDSLELERYFRAMMWLGRVDLRIVETEGSGNQTFRRKQFDTAAALTLIMGAAERERFERIDGIIGGYVGEHDNTTPMDLARLLNDLGATTLAEVQALTDEAILEKLATGTYGAQRIASRIIIVEAPTGEPLPLDVSYRLFGQRYTVDSHTFSNTTYDRVAGRMMPNPLDAAFAALGNNSALPLLGSELENDSYTGALAKTRVLVDAHEAEYWEGSAYTRWLDALRTLSPSEEETVGGIPVTAEWNARILSTQLASWAQARHDTILYAKQSYTSGVTCEFPDAYVDPYPEFYRKLRGIAESLADITAQIPDGTGESVLYLKDTIANWSSDFVTVTEKLGLMADNELSGTPHSDELIEFINDAVKWDEQNICGGTTYSNTAGWYLKLYPSALSGIELDPTIADVHTQPTDEAGNDVGRILHVGTGLPRAMVVTANTCSGPRAYVGLASSYGELITENWQRLNDLEWAGKIQNEPYPDVPWMSPILAP